MSEYLGAYIMIAGVVLIVGTVTLLDWLTRRKDRQARNRTV